jgi:hypothetical protein
MEGWVVVSVPVTVLAAMASLVFLLARVQHMVDAMPMPSPTEAPIREQVPAPDPVPSPTAGVLMALDLNR